MKYDIEKLKELYIGRNMTLNEVADATGLSKGQVRYYLHKNNIFKYIDMVKYIKLDEEELKELFLIKGYSTKKISELLGIPEFQVIRNLNIYKIKRREHVLTKDELLEYYIIQKKTLKEIGDMFGYHWLGVRYCLIKYNIPLHGQGFYKRSLKRILSKSKLYSLYIEQNLSTKEIADMYEFSQSSVQYLVKLYGIKKSKQLSLEAKIRNYNKNKYVKERKNGILE